MGRAVFALERALTVCRAMMVLRGLHQEVKRRYKDWERARTARMARTANQTPAELAIAAFWRRVAQMEEERDW